MISAHQVLYQRPGKDNEPYAQRLKLGWVIIGETCLGSAHQPDIVTVNKTSILRNGQESLIKPCPNEFEIKDTLEDTIISAPGELFCHTRDDDTLGLSQEDKEFIRLMEAEFYKTPEGNWSAPLPFKCERPRLDKNGVQVVRKAENLAKSLKKDPVKQDHFGQFMHNIFAEGHPELAPPIQKEEECWFLPIFAVYHPKQTGKIRAVFDSSAKFNGCSLNDILLTGPDMTNNLVGVLLKFRKEKVPITTDIEQMFVNFYVHEQHRNFLRFLWFRDNDPTKDLVEYRMRVHIFGNSPSPAVATIGLRKSASSHGEDVASCDEACDFVKNNFYVDDGLISFSGEEAAVNLMKQTQSRLKQEGNLNLPKISSNKVEVLASFPQEDLVNDLGEMDFRSGTVKVQRSLGLSWDVKSDTFLYRVSDEEKPCTKRGILSTVNSVLIL